MQLNPFKIETPETITSPFFRAQKTGSVLRVCVIEDGRMISQKRIKCGRSLTVGRAPHNEVVIDAVGIPRSITLVEAKGSDYLVRLIPEVSTEISLGKSRSKVDTALLPYDCKERGAFRLAVGTTVTMTVARIVILFHLVEPMAEPVAAILPKTISKRIWGAGDQCFWMVALICMVVEAVGLSYFYTVPRPEPMMETVLSSRWGELMRLPPPRRKINPKASRPRLGKKTPTARPKPNRPSRPTNTMAVGEREKLRQKILKEMRPFGSAGAGAALSGLLSQGELGSVDQAFEGVQGPNHQKPRGPRLRGPQAGEVASVGPLGTQTGKKVGSGAKRSPRVSLPKRGEASLQMDGQLDQAAVARLIRRKPPQLQACYTSALRRDETLSGKILVELNVGIGGRVQEATIEEDSIGEPRVISCILRKVRRWQFDVNLDAEAWVGIPLVFQPGD